MVDPNATWLKSVTKHSFLRASCTRTYSGTPPARRLWTHRTPLIRRTPWHASSAPNEQRWMRPRPPSSRRATILALEGRPSRVCRDVSERRTMRPPVLGWPLMTLRSSPEAMVCPRDSTLHVCMLGRAELARARKHAESSRGCGASTSLG
jgi:hypothetical protein